MTRSVARNEAASAPVNSAATIRTRRIELGFSIVSRSLFFLFFFISCPESAGLWAKSLLIHKAAPSPMTGRAPFWLTSSIPTAVDGHSRLVRQLWPGLCCHYKTVTALPLTLCHPHVVQPEVGPSSHYFSPGQWPIRCQQKEWTRPKAAAAHIKIQVVSSFLLMTRGCSDNVSPIIGRRLAGQGSQL